MMDLINSSLVFRMVEAEEEYVEQLEILISCFLRPFKVHNRYRFHSLQGTY